jgi:threonylcarbamoyladenosine tRNA methylthiotransferase MtaB
MPSFFIATFGCRTNQADSAGLRDEFLQAGYREAKHPADAAVIVVNSCTVTHRSDQQVRQLARRLRRQNPAARLVVTGCYAQRDPEALACIEGVDVVVGNTHRDHLVPISLEANGRTDGMPGAIHREDWAKFRSIRPVPAEHLGRRSRPVVKIQDGCDATCSYCIIPLVRGPSRSVPPDQVLSQVESLVQAGFPEIVLTGIHIGTYGLYLNPRMPLDRLLERITEIPGLGMVRLSSIEPMELSRRVIELAAHSERIAPHFHICLQSGSDRILRLMRRPYDRARFRDLVREIRERLPLAGIGTDVITGFPGETEQDHRETVAFLEEGLFTYLHIFPYSDRAGTRAWGMPEKVPPAVIRERAAELRRLGRRLQGEFARRLVGEKIRFVTLSEEVSCGREALTENYVRAAVDSALPPGTLGRGVVTDCRGDFLLIRAETFHVRKGPGTFAGMTAGRQAAGSSG